ncbi:MAG: methyltransferase domain-containing protein [Candidatus Binataceae bacterium]|nr:methyltransferase domain-containing protein [Candidatus Binataceae bacterium]
MSASSADPQQLKDAQRLDWDAAAAGWKKWWPVFERSAQHVSDRLVDLAGVRPGARVLDIATGNGEPAITAARRVGASGRVIATDQSAGMLAIARERAAQLGVANVEFRESDGENLAIDDRDFDAILCRWGLMFMPDVAGALARLGNRLRPSGRLATAVWATGDKVPMITLGAEAARKIVGLPPPPADALGPLRLADESIVRGALIAAGFKDVTVERLQVVFELDSAAAFTQFRVDVSAQFRMLLERQTDAVRARIVAAVTDAARGVADGAGRVRTVNETICFAASR